jgi:hypothetical protein
MAELSRYISTVATMGNSDYPEGSLAAVSKVIDRFKSGEGRPDAAKMVLLVTDVVGHNGGPIGTTANVNRDCSLSSLVQKINDYAASLGDPARFKFFYVVPDPQYLDENATGDRQNATTTCPTAPGAVTIFNAKVQMETLINQIVTAVPKEKRGGALLDTSGRHAWPLKDNNLVTSLIPMIASAKPQQKSLSCLATKFGAFEGNRPIYNWEADSVASILNDPNPVLKMDDVLRQEQNRTLGNQLIQLRINRCCVDTGALLPTIGGSASPSPSPAKPLSCEKEYIQTVNYRIINE